MPASVRFTVFTKPWKQPLPELGAYLTPYGFGGIELPVRPGYQVPPEEVRRGLPAAARLLADFGLAIGSVAGPTDAPTIEACATAGVPIIRIDVGIPRGVGYLEHEAAVRKRFDQLVPELERHGVTIGIQNHAGRSVASCMAIRHLIEGYDPRCFGAVWDPGHCALEGELPEMAIDILWSHLCLVNLKNPYWQRSNGPEALVAHYTRQWTSGRQGICPWGTVADLLQQRGYHGDMCLSAAYTDMASLDRLLADDVRFATSLFS
jgi:sugar phosphate isomerase/epimerase